MINKLKFKYILLSHNKYATYWILWNKVILDGYYNLSCMHILENS